jgi:hypothetical protein
MVVMGIALKVVVGLVLLLPMTAYVVGSLVAAADEPREHAPIIVEERTQKPEPSQSPTDKPTNKPSGHKSEHGEKHGNEGPPTVIPPSPSDLFDDHGGDDNSGKGSGGDDNSGKGSGDD